MRIDTWIALAIDDWPAIDIHGNVKLPLEAAHQDRPANHKGQRRPNRAARWRFDAASTEAESQQQHADPVRQLHVADV